MRFTKPAILAAALTLALWKFALRRQSTGTSSVATGRHERSAFCYMLEDVIVRKRPLGYPHKLTIKKVRKYLLAFWKGKE